MGLDLNKKYPSLRTIILKQNYRSTKTILDCSNLLINHNKYRVKKDLVTDNEKGADIDVFSGFTRNEEADWVSRKIIELKAKNPGFSFNDVAVLFRNSYLSSSFENKFTMSRIPYVIYGGIRFYQRKEVKIALSYFRLAVNLDEDFSFYKIINEPKRKIGDQTVLLIQDESKSHGLSAYSYIKNIGEVNLICNIIDKDKENSLDDIYKNYIIKQLRFFIFSCIIGCLLFVFEQQINFSILSNLILRD